MLRLPEPVYTIVGAIMMLFILLFLRTLIAGEGM